MLLNIIIFIIAATSITSFYFAIRTLYKKWPYFCMASVKAVNNDQLATRNFLKMLSEAKKDISIFDHGNVMDGSIYQNERVIESVKEKLEDNPDFVIQCGFTSRENESNKFEKEFKDHPQVVIVTRDNPPEGLAHYKIIDGGKKAYLSRHTMGARNREVWFYDFSRVVERRGQEKVVEKFIGKYLRDINQTFLRSNLSASNG